jgi:hypothetical protein
MKDDKNSTNISDGTGNEIVRQTSLELWCVANTNEAQNGHRLLEKWLI